MPPSQHGPDPPVPRPAAPAQNTAQLQAYQMQMMSEHQQNAGRLMEARQEQEKPQPSSPSTEPPSSKRKIGHLLNDDAAESPVGASSAVRPACGGNATAGTAEASGVPYVVLYRVVCSSGYRKCNGRIYQDRPRVAVVDGEVHLTGSRPVLDLGALLAARKDPAEFVVFHESDCVDGDETYLAQVSATPPGAEPFREIIFVVSEKLQRALQRLSRFAPNDGAYGRSQQDNRPSPRLCSAPFSTSPSEYSLYFLYHHRDAIHKAVTMDPCGRDVKPLLMYVLDSPKGMFADCDALFGQGLVSPETLPWLFLPNEVVVSNSGQGEVAFVLRHFSVSARGVGSDSVELACWNWGYDGRWLRRKENTGTVTVSRGVATPIAKLTAYPLRYADERTRLRLFERGSRFWASRNSTHFSYEGPDYNGERIYVGSHFLTSVPPDESRCAYWKSDATQPCDSRFMIDYRTYYKFHKNTEAFAFSGRRAAAFDKAPHQLSATADLSSVDTMLLPPGIHAFFLQEKKWGMCSSLPK